MKWPPFLLRLMNAPLPTPAMADREVKARPASLPRYYAEILAALAVAEQATFEIALSVGRSVGYVAPSVSQLKGMGLVVDTGRRLPGGPHGRGVTIWGLAK